jgi:hypothetical protein
MRAESLHSPPMPSTCRRPLPPALAMARQQHHGNCRYRPNFLHPLIYHLAHCRSANRYTNGCCLKSSVSSSVYYTISISVNTTRRKSALINMEYPATDLGIMDPTTESPLAFKAEPTTPHCRLSPDRGEEAIPPTPSKPKTKHTELALGDETADFTIICEGTQYMAHKSILTTSSPYFARMFRFSGSVRFSLFFPFTLGSLDLNRVYRKPATKKSKYQTLMRFP